jgi:hypothetical protein
MLGKLLKQQAEQQNNSNQQMNNTAVQSNPTSMYGSYPQMFTKQNLTTEEENDDKDEKAMAKLMKTTLTKFGNEQDWEVAIFELGLVLERIWPHKDQLDITKYMSVNSHTHYDPEFEKRADRLIYFALTLATKKDSYAKLQIVASNHSEAVPCVMINEGKKLYLMFLSLFTMTNLHQASLPSTRKLFHEITQKDPETILNYISRVDIIVAAMAKLGEKVSQGTWIYALGNGPRPEFEACKDGILYNDQGCDTVLSVKTKLISEEAVLIGKSKNCNKAIIATKEQEKIAMKLLDIKAKEAKLNEEKAQFLLFTKGKGKQQKGKQKGKRKWNDNQSPWQPYNNWIEQMDNYWKSNAPALTIVFLVSWLFVLSP